MSEGRRCHSENIQQAQRREKNSRNKRTFSSFNKLELAISKSISVSK